MTQIIRLPKDYVAFVDDEDYLRLRGKSYKPYSWYVMFSHKGVPIRVVRPISYFGVRPMSYDVLGVKSYKEIYPMQIDHEDRNPLNNQKSNLRIVTRSINNKNRNSWKYP